MYIKCPKCDAVFYTIRDLKGEGFCPKCGKMITSDKSRLVAFILSLFLGWYGVHKFYVGKIGIGIFYLLTFGGFFFGNFVDLIYILLGKFRDDNNDVLLMW